MLSSPTCGWTDISINGIEIDRASYLTDIPMDCIDAFWNRIKHGTPLNMSFDAEGWNWSLVETMDSLVVIDDRAESDEYNIRTIISTFRDDELYKLALELIYDIETSINLWSEWSVFDCDKNEVKNRETTLRARCEMLRTTIEKRQLKAQTDKRGAEND